MIIVSTLNSSIHASSTSGLQVSLCSRTGLTALQKIGPMMSRYCCGTWFFRWNRPSVPSVSASASMLSMLVTISCTTFITSRACLSSRSWRPSSLSGSPWWACVSTDTTHQISSKQLTFYLIVVNQNTPEMFFDKRMQLEQIHDALEPDFLQVSENDDPGCPNLLGLDKGDRISGIRESIGIPERSPACEAPSSLNLLIRIFSPP